MSTETLPPPPTPDDDTRRQWHRLFGIALTEVFEGAPWRVELEQELAVRSQLLDVAIIEAIEEGAERRLPPDLPDGLEGLRAHNLLTYKSHHEALNAWALDELPAEPRLWKRLLAARTPRGGLKTWHQRLPARTVARPSASASLLARGWKPLPRAGASRLNRRTHRAPCLRLEG